MTQKLEVESVFARLAMDPAEVRRSL